MRRERPNDHLVGNSVERKINETARQTSPNLFGIDNARNKRWETIGFKRMLKSSVCISKY